MSHPNTPAVARGLGVVQGLSEFLPISSDGHSVSLGVAMVLWDVFGG
jgi:undecaprenyl pyrophosphate phosphatase UppP